MYQWIYGVPLSGLSFPMVTYSGTYAVNYDTAQLSGVISKDGGAWAALGTRFSGIPGNGVYTLTSLSSTEMQCYQWIIKITANSGCFDQTIAGYNLSGIVNVSTIAAQIWNSLPATYTSTTTYGGGVVLSGGYATVSGLAGVLTATSAITNNVASGFAPILAAVSAPPTSGIAAQVWNSLTATFTSNTTFAVAASGNAAILTATSAITNNVASGFAPVLTAVSGVSATVNYSGVAAQVWNSLPATYTSSTTFGGGVALSGGYSRVSGLDGILTAVSNVVVNTASGFSPVLVAVSGLANRVSGIPGIQTAVSNVTATTNTSAVAFQVWNTVTADFTSSTTYGGSPVDYSGFAAQVWNSLIGTYTSNTTFGGAVILSGEYVTISGLNVMLSAIVNVPTTVASGWVGLSGLAHPVDSSGMNNLLTAVSNVTATVNYSSMAAQVWNTQLASYASAPTFGGSVLKSGQGGVATVDTSGIANQVWNTVTTVNTSATTFGGAVLLSGSAGNVSGLSNILSAISGLKNDVSGLPGTLAAVSGLAVNVSGIQGTLAAVSGVPQAAASGFAPILTAVSNIPVNSSGIPGLLTAVSSVAAGVATISIQDADSLTSGTLAHTMRLLRWEAWENITIDQTYNPNRLYMRTNEINTSSWFSLTYTSAATSRVRGG